MTTKEQPKVSPSLIKKLQPTASPSLTKKVQPTTSPSLTKKVQPTASPNLIKKVLVSRFDLFFVNDFKRFKRKDSRENKSRCFSLKSK